MTTAFQATHTPLSSCPACGTELDAAGGSDKAGQPKPGDLSVCINCATILQFDEQLHLHLAPGEVVNQARAENPELVDYVQAVTDMLKRGAPS